MPTDSNRQPLRDAVTAVVDGNFTPLLDLLPSFWFWFAVGLLALLILGGFVWKTHRFWSKWSVVHRFLSRLTSAPLPQAQRFAVAIACIEKDTTINCGPS